MCRHVLPQSCTAMYAFCFISLSFVSGGKLGTRPMGLGLMCLGPCGHRAKPPERNTRMMMVLFANCVHTIQVTYLSVAFPT